MKNVINKIKNPAKFTPTNIALLGAIIFHSAMFAVSTLANVRFDGALDFHIGTNASWWICLSDVIISWIIVAFCFLALAKALGSKIRMIDILGIIGLVRGIILVPAFFYLIFKSKIDLAINLDSLKTNTTNIQFGDPIHIVFFTIFMFLTVLSVILLIYYYFQSYKINSNLKDLKLILSFLGALILAEITSKILIYLVGKLL